jgi:hypothetical protein
VAILDAQAVVVEVNDSWRRFADTPAAGAFDRVGVGGSYLNACRAGAERGDPIAARALTGVKRVLAREVARVEMEYDDHGTVAATRSASKRWSEETAARWSHGPT